MPFFLLLLLFVSSPLAAEPRLVPDQRLVDLSAPPDRLSSFDAETFATLALVASGSEGPALEAQRARLRSLAADLKKETGSVSGERARAEAVIAFLYRNVLAQYSQYQTRVDAALSTGSYNCVSSAILFAYFAKSAGLNVGGIETPEHAFCTVESNGKTFDVETTNPYGVDPGSRKELSSQTDAQKRYAVVPKNYYNDRKAISDRRFIGLIYANRISDLERGGNFEEAVSLAVDARELQGADAPPKELPLHFLNYAVSLANTGRAGEGLDFIAAVSDRWGDCVDFRSFAATAIGNMVNDELKKSDYRRARDLVARYSAMLESSTRAEYLRVITMQDLQSAVGSLSFAEARSKIIASKSDIFPSDFVKILSYAYGREADRIRANSNWLGAASFLDAGLAELPGNRDLAQQRDVYRRNYAVEAHNAAVAEYRKGNVDGARKILEVAKSAIPESAMLENDLRQMR